ncbi:uncharacterized protein PGTG_13099 [Puccinia graminis f. sp. tritici CRL 75-36-700-3]|uniref:DNA 3'-5' helicase n=1 Tax=Puccinia graminis f. sp. tritici (strain CRL 75-36-700-3 / race SCCL) TaxID=418459 RepID=E3KQZ2_PUCGT|nr:uncharacterized protein PGTG_13099 [Puccinia graminis f. sp. tritici CRL 75-36-700-3]EFP86717.2 hypothetical protein PGTG_13099 [Puccinia graminis f. sp. tritici CRL 75-36-700-3]
MLNQVSASTRRNIRSPRRVWSATGINVYKKVSDKNDEDLKSHIAKVSLDFYGQPSKLLQVNAVFNLVQGRNTFLLAGTGFGKSRIAEIYYRLIPQVKKAVVLVLNPLDSLGDNQVYEKEQAGFTAINLTKSNFNEETAINIENGVYNFVYMSPETFLNNKIWDAVYFSSKFQNRLALIVIDEAHMVYIWGLVASGQGKKAAAILLRYQDIGIFRPSYGNLGAHLLFRNNKPILLLSATCRPVAIEAIKRSLKLEAAAIDVLQGELTRPEIRIIRIPMEKSLASSLDLIKVFPSVRDVPNSKLVPSLVYSGSRNRTLTVMDVIDRARETPGSSLDPHNTCIRRYHSCTGDLDKVRCVDQFSKEEFPIISATMALGLGQNWKRVRMVAHMGRADPAQIAQMIGRCGRDGRDGLALLFMEKNRRSGKNSVDQFKMGSAQTDEDRVDALAITPVCLRVAFSLDNLRGYVPLRFDDPEYIKEVAREAKEGFRKCQCSNCEVASSDTLVKNLPLADEDNFDDILANNFIPHSLPDLTSKYPKKKPVARKRKYSAEEMTNLNTLKTVLIDEMRELYESVVQPGGAFAASDLFGLEEADSLALNYLSIITPEDVCSYIGGQCFAGQLQRLADLISKFKLSNGQMAHGPRPKAAKLTQLDAQLDTNPAETALQGSAALVDTQDGGNEGQLSETVFGRTMTKKEMAAAKRDQKQAERIEKARLKEIELERNRQRKQQVAGIMADSWAEHMQGPSRSNIDPDLHKL